MPINISGKHIEIGDSLRDFITMELRSVIKRYMGDVLEAQVAIGKDHHLFTTDVSVHISRSFVVHCHGQDDHAYRSASQAIEKLESKIKRYKTRLRDLKRHQEHPPIISSHYVIKPAEEDTVDEVPLIIAETAGEINHLSVGEAVMHMDLTEAPMVMFRNATNGELNVVYRRSDGHIGWVDPNRRLVG